jgi:RHS repeat-associated protein
VERVERGTDGGPRVWKYRYDGAGLLADVEAPDGRLVSFAYDPFARRVKKQVSRPDGAGALVIEASSRFVWEKDRLVHEIRTRADEAGDPIVEERTYFYDEQCGDPLAERCDVITTAGRAAGAFLFHVNDPLGTPEHLVRGDGRVEGAIDRTAWGKTTPAAGAATTAHRFQGQYEDPETGLHYNRYRYYDPEIGRYTTPDPSGRIPDPNLYRYVTNPVSWVDPYGLEHRATATFTPQGGTPVQMGGGKTYTSKYKSESDGFSKAYNKDNNLHPMTNFAKKGPDGALAHRTSDTEAQILRDLDKMKKGGTKLKGGHLQIQGELPPCSACDKKMQAFAKKHGCTIQYKDKSGNAYDYPK